MCSTYAVGTSRSDAITSCMYIKLSSEIVAGTTVESETLYSFVSRMV